jgi:hypothetical protein
VAEAPRVARPGGTVAAHLWDYAHGMRMLRAFWDPDEGRPFPLCHPGALAELFERAGLAGVETGSV